MLLNLLQVKPDERREFSWSAAWFMTVLGAYYIVRPVREALGSLEGSKNLPWLFTAVFLTMLVAVPVYSRLVAKFSRRRLVPFVYRFLIVNLLLFSAAMYTLEDEILKYVARVFFVWVTVYVLFMTSLFWSVMADVFDRDDGKRLFGAIAGFGSLGAILASLFVGQTAQYLGPKNLLIVSAVLMELGLFCFRRLSAARNASQSPSSTPKMSQNPFSGFVQVVRAPFLRKIMLYVFCTTICGTYLYMRQADMLKELYPDSKVRVGVFANIDLAVQIVTIALQLLVASRLLKFSVLLTLCCLPFVYGVGYLGLTLAPDLSVIAAIMTSDPYYAMGYPSLVVLVTTMVLSRASTYGLSVPALGVLYTVVSREDKYKAKSVIDTLVIRGGDAGTNWTVTVLKKLGASSVVLSALMLPAVAVGLTLSVLLARSKVMTKKDH